MRRWIKHHIPQIMAIFFWISMISLIYTTLDSNNITLEQFLINLESDITRNWYGAVAFIILFALFRPFTLIPAIILVALGGRIFGVWEGFIYGLIAKTLSAVIPYYAGQLFAGDVQTEESANPLRRMGQRLAIFLRGNAFESLVVLRLAHIPYDAVSFAAGNVHIPLRMFMLATFVGNISGTYAFAALGASVEGSIFDGDYHFNVGLLISSLVVFVVSIGAARYLRLREQRLTDNPDYADWLTYFNQKLDAMRNATTGFFSFNG